MDRRITLVGIICFAVVALAIVLNSLLSQPTTLRGTVYSDPYPGAPDFTLVDAKGEPFQLSQHKNKLILLFFGYTYCPDVCPTTLAELKRSNELLKDDAAKVQVVFVSVDPDRDTSEKMQEYVERFNPLFIGLSGEEDQLAPIWKDYGIFREIVAGTSEKNYIVNHTARVFLIDQNGNLRVSYGFQTPPEDIAQDIEILLKEKND